MGTNTTLTEIPLGDRENRRQSVIIIPALNVANSPGVLDLQTVSGTTVADVYLWANSTGSALRYSTTFPTSIDSDGTALGTSSGASLALDNLAAVAINTSLISDTANTDDLGSDPKSWRTLYWTTSLKKIGTTWDVTLAATEPAAASYTYTFPDAGAAANVMLDTGAANVIAYTKGTSTIAMAANADLSIATGITLSVTATCTLDQNLAVAGTPTFASVTGGTATVAAGSITDSSGAISFGNENLTTTGTINIAADSIKATWGASGATDSGIWFDGSGNLMLYDSNLGAARSLTEMYTGTSLNPTVAGNLTVGDGNFTWTNTASSETAIWTLAATTVDGIQIASSNTTADAVQITANATTSGNVLSLVAVDAALAGGGGYLYCYDGAAQDFAVRRYGATTIAGSAAGTATLTLTAGDIKITSGYIDSDSPVGDGGHNFATADDGTSATDFITITNSNVAFDKTLLVIDGNATGAYDAVAITHDSTGNGIKITGTAVTGTQANFIGPASQTASIVKIDGTTGSWIGAATTGMLHLSSDGALVADASLLRISSTGAISAANDGACLEVIETGAAQATTYAVRIASTSNEALHVDTGLSLFDERVTITLADNTGPALAITNPDTTGNTNAATITPSGSGYGLYVAPVEADTMGIGIVAGAASTVPYVKLDGVTGTGYVGAENIGLLHITNDGTLAHANASLFYIANAGIPANDSRGHCLRIVDTGNAAAGTMGYPVYISSNDATVGGLLINTAATGTALAVTAGTVNIDGASSFGSTFFFDGTPDTANAADSAISITTTVTNLDTTIGACASMTLADGAQGQVKIITMTVDNGDATITPANPLGFATIKFTAVGQTAMLFFLASKWRLIHGYGVTIA